MRFGDRIILALYTAATVYAAWTAVHEALHGATWPALAIGAVSLTPALAIAEQAELRHLRQHLQAHKAREERRQAADAHRRARAAELRAAGLERIDAP